MEDVRGAYRSLFAATAALRWRHTVGDQHVLEQCWVDQSGVVEWREVPVVNIVEPELTTPEPPKPLPMLQGPVTAYLLAKPPAKAEVGALISVQVIAADTLPSWWPSRDKEYPGCQVWPLDAELASRPMAELIRIYSPHFKR